MTSKKHCWGEYYGYPNCCIQAFHKLLLADTKFQEISDEWKTATCNGFVPCQQCAERILKKEILISDLILPTRKATKPFIRGV
jgi:hypothetical protein